MKVTFTKQVTFELYDKDGKVSLRLIDKWRGYGYLEGSYQPVGRGVIEKVSMIVLLPAEGLFEAIFGAGGNQEHTGFEVVTASPRLIEMFTPPPSNTLRGDT